MFRLASVLVFFILTGCVQADDTYLEEVIPSDYNGYSWPVAPDCTQRIVTNPNFANNVRKRPDGSLRPHLGVDFIPPANDLHVYAAKKGTVVVN